MNQPAPPQAKRHLGQILIELVPYTSGSYSGQLVLTSAGPAATWVFDLRGLIP